MEAAEALQISESALKSRLHAAVIRLRRSLSADTNADVAPICDTKSHAGQRVRELTNEL